MKIVSAVGSWILRNLYDIILVGVAVGIVIYDQIAKYIGWAELKADSKIDFLLLLIAGYVIKSVMEFRQLGRMRDYLTPRFRSKPHPFISHLFEFLDSIENGVRDEKLEFCNRHESMAMMLRMMDSCQSSFHGLNYYSGGWKTGWKEYYNASMGALRRGVKVNRFFLVRDEFCSSGLMNVLVDEMEKQSNLGINVYFLFESSIDMIPYFRKNPLRGCSLYDETILSYDTSPSRRDDTPDEITVTWNTDEVKKRNPFMILTHSGLVYSFPKDSHRIHEWIEEMHK
jgi:hypothetical protein